MRPVSSRTKLTPRFSAVLLVVLLIGGLLSPARAQTSCTVDTLVPVLRDVTINQGLHNYPALVNGKQTLTKFYLSRPLCAGTTQTIRLTSATLKINGGAVATISQPQNNLSTPPELVPYAQAPAKSSSGDPLWVVSGDALGSLAQGGPLSFEAVLKYTSTLSSTERTITLGSFNGSAISKTLLAKTDSLRLLAVRFGDPNATATQFTTGTGATAEDAYLKGLATLSRMFPVAGGVADLNDPLSLGKGVRHNLKTGIFDVSRFMSSGKFCDSGSAFGASGNGIKLQLADHLQQYNTANSPDKTADRIMGIVDEAITAGCAEGIASFGGKESWVTARYRNTSPKRTGATMGMELGHNAGGVPCGVGSSLLQPLQCAQDRDHDFDAFHSRNVHADVAAGDVDRSFNIYGPEYFLDDARSVMQYRFQPESNWTNASTLLEPPDWNLLLCRLGGPVVNDCTIPVEQTAANAAAASVSVLVGTTDGTKAGTEIFDSFAKEDGVDTFHAPSGAIHLLQKNSSGTVLSDIPVWVIGGHSDHTPGQTAGHQHQKGLFSVSYTTPPGTSRLELRNVATGELLYAVDENPSGVRNVQVSLFPEGSDDCVGDCGGEATELAGPFSSPLTQTISFDDLAAGTEINDQYPGVTFTGDESQPTAVGDCFKAQTPCRVPQASTASGDIALWNKPLELPVDPAPTSENKDLQIDFASPQRRVGMFIGNDDSGSTQAELTAFDVAGNEIEVPGGVTRTSFGSPVQTFLGLDAGSDRISSVSLSYGESPFGEEIDSLMFEAAPVPTTTRFLARTTAEHDDAQRLRAHYFAKCDDANEPLETSVAPTSVSEDNKVATWEYAFEAKDLCTFQGNMVFLVRVNDGFTQTDFVQKIVRADQDDPPYAFITNPEATGDAPDIFEHEEIALRGLGHDEEDGVLAGDRVRWYLTGPDFAEREEGTGDTRFIPAPPGGWTPGVYTARLVVTDSSGNSAEDKMSITVKKDSDNDYLTDGTCGKENDGDSSDAFADWDRDGTANHSDSDPCKALVTGTGDFDPDELNVPSTGGSDHSVTMKISAPGWNLREVDRKSVHIAEIAGLPVRVASTEWKVASDGLTATAKFSRSELIDLIYHKHGIKNRRISISLDGVSSTTPQWGLRVTDSTFIKYSG